MREHTGARAFRRTVRAGLVVCLLRRCVFRIRTYRHDIAHYVVAFSYIHLCIRT